MLVLLEKWNWDGSQAAAWGTSGWLLNQFLMEGRCESQERDWLPAVFFHYQMRTSGASLSERECFFIHQVALVL